MKRLRILIFAIILVGLAACTRERTDETGKNVNEEILTEVESRENFSSAPYYETDQYWVYRCFYNMLSWQCDKISFDYWDREVLDGITYLVYQQNEMRVLVEDPEGTKTSESGLGRYGKYLFIRDGEIILEFEDEVELQAPEVTIQFFYIDINGDGKEELVIRRGSSTGGCWEMIIKGYDFVSEEWIDILDTGSGYRSELTQRQSAGLKEMLERDEGYQQAIGRRLGEAAYIASGVCPFFDMDGNLYCEMDVWENPVSRAGEILVFFQYNREKDCFDVADYLYCPLEVRAD